jgi:hypothetical protein
MPTSVRLDTKTERIVERLARQKGQTKSQVIREAIAFAATRETRRPDPRKPYEAIKHLIGIAHGGPPDLSERTGEKFTQMLLARRARRQ